MPRRGGQVPRLLSRAADKILELRSNLESKKQEWPGHRRPLPQCLSVAPGRPGFRRAAQQAGRLGGGRMGIGKSKARRYDRRWMRRSPTTVSPASTRPRTGWSRLWIPQGPPEVHAPGGSERRAPGRPARNRKDLAGIGGRRRGGGAVLPCWRERPSTSETSSRSRGSRLRQRPAPGSCPVPGLVGARTPPEDPARDEGLPQRYRDSLHIDSGGGRGRVPCWHPPCSVEFWWAR